MKKFKKIISAVLASSCMLSAAALNGNAMYLYNVPVESEKYADMLDGFEYVERLSGDDKAVYFKSGTLLTLTDCGIEFSAEFPGDTPIDEIKAIADSIVPDTEYSVEEHYRVVWTDKSKGEHENIRYITLTVRDKAADPSAAAKAKELCNALKEKLAVTSFDYFGRVVNPSYSYIERGNEAVEGGVFFVHSTQPISVGDVQSALDDGGFAVDIVSSGEWYTFVPREKITADEIFAAAELLKERFGISYGCIAPADVPAYDVDGIDVLNSLDGDANCDGALTVADATAIMQAIGNPDKYGLSAQAKFNADIYNTGDGVTALDALKILRIEAGLE